MLAWLIVACETPPDSMLYEPYAKQLDIADSVFKSGQLDSAYQMFSKVYEETLNRPEYDAMFIRSSSALAKCHFFRGEADSVVYYIQQHLPIAIRNGDASTTRREYNNLALAYMELGYHEGAVETFKTVLLLAEAANDKKRLATAYNNMGLVYLGSLQLDRSLAYEYFMKSRQLKEELGLGGLGLIPSYGNLATYFLLVDNADSATYYLQILQDLCTENNEPQVCGFAKGIELDWVITHTSPEERASFVTEQEEISRTSSDFYFLNYADRFLTYHYFALEDYDKTLFHLKKLLDRHRESPISTRVLMDYYDLIVEVYSREGNNDSALYYQSEAKAFLINQQKQNLALAMNDLKMSTMAMENEQALKEKDARLWRQRRRSGGLLAGVLVLGLSGWLALRSRQRRQRERLEAEMVKAELKALRAQINPHFIFNALASIQRYVLKNDALTANNYLTKFSKYIRRVLYNSDQLILSLADELDALEEYLQIENIRLGDRFTYAFTVDDSVDLAAWQFPGMLLQTFAENAIWHGLMPKTEDCVLRIKVVPIPQGCCIQLEDNGIGREAARKLDTRVDHKSKGLSIVHDKIHLFNKQYPDIELEFEIVDLKDDQGKALGTRVEMRLTKHV